jgi:hypothetical protein
MNGCPYLTYQPYSGDYACDLEAQIDCEECIYGLGEIDPNGYTFMKINKDSKQ